MDSGRPTIDYYSFLVYLHLAVSAIAFSMGERAACWDAPLDSVAGWLTVPAAGTGLAWFRSRIGFIKIVD